MKPDRDPYGAIDIVAACNDREILELNLLQSPEIASGLIKPHLEWHATSAGAAYNRALDATRGEIVVFAHQDVYLPAGWTRLLMRRVEELNRTNPDWALLSTFGVALNGWHQGIAWASSLGAIVGRLPVSPVRVQSFDEMLIVMRRSAGVRFDEGLPGFHMYGTDIVQIARAAGRGSYVVALPIIHNDRFHAALGPDFAEAYHYVRRKWRRCLPVWTPILEVTRFGLPLRQAIRHTARSRADRRLFAVEPQTHPEVYAALCGWSDLSAVATGSIRLRRPSSGSRALDAVS